MRTGTEDIGKFITMISVDMGGAFERNFYLNQSIACGGMLNRCRAIVCSSMLDEMAITMREQNEDKI